MENGFTPIPTDESNNPSIPCPFEYITGKFCDNASIYTNPKVSCIDGIAKTSLEAYISRNLSLSYIEWSY